MSKTKTMRLTVPGSVQSDALHSELTGVPVNARTGYVPSVDSPDPISGSSTIDDRQDVTAWLLDRLSEINLRAKQIISEHLATIRPPESGGVGYSSRRHRKAP